MFQIRIKQTFKWTTVRHYITHYGALCCYFLHAVCCFFIYRDINWVLELISETNIKTWQKRQAISTWLGCGLIPSSITLSGLESCFSFTVKAFFFPLLKNQRAWRDRKFRQSCQTIGWFLLLKCKDLLLFFVIMTVNEEFWTAGWTNEATWRRHMGLRETVMSSNQQRKLKNHC